MSVPGFETETQVEDRKRKRQEEWEKVRNPDEPETAPELEPFDGRSLFDRLKEQKDAKDADFQESKKFKNLIHTLDDDEVDHLKTVDELKFMEERKKREEELKEMEEYRSRVAELQEKEAEQKLADSKPKSNSSSTTAAANKLSSQKLILSGAVKRKLPLAIEDPPSALKVLAILPGIVDYSSDDSGSDSSYDEDYAGTRDLTGREIKKQSSENC